MKNKNNVETITTKAKTCLEPQKKIRGTQQQSSSRPNKNKTTKIETKNKICTRYKQWPEDNH